MIQASALAAIEEKIKRQLCTVTSLIIGGSVGSINGGLVACGVPCPTIKSLFKNNAPSYFPIKNSVFSILKRLVTGARSLYEAQPIIDDFMVYSNNARMRDTRCPFIAVADNVNTGAPALMSTEDQAWQRRFLAEAVANSFAAPYFFNLRNIDEDQTTYADPGIGADANPVMLAWTEVIRRGWHLDGITDIYVIGTGIPDSNIPYKQTRKWGFIRQSLKTIRFAASESDLLNQRYAEYFDILLSNVNVHTANPLLNGPAEFANIDDLDKYDRLGLEAVESLDLDPFYEKIKELDTQLH
jgi:patatin-like phospholipase/acyl hydrolase